ncbi:AHH domain-containing protein [Bradyrhizobium amphicarpaeae]|uniref:Uncharacterized protein n=1 Tax=Bradyrhizobium amphicarpaeae TaxID=1404768 RepID=A0A2U8PXL4_9BRAD|nr:AHH domain-containing protein [Bradyrhizobium amphicarpaeae]AWM02560.1 hypothetical protein CIT40_22680 [Bradyrhizobium amphicarpaeae]
MSILVYHHMIPRAFRSHSAFRDIDQQKLGIDSFANGIYLPMTYQLAEAMGISPHPGGHKEIYYKAIECVLDRITKIPEADVREAKIRTLMDAMRIGFSNGHLYTNLPNGKTAEEFNLGVETVIKRSEAYVERYSDELKKIRDRKTNGLETGLDHLQLWSAILDDARREELLHDAIRSNPNKAVTSGNKNLRGTPYSKFAPVDDNFQIPPTTPANPRDIPLPPPFFPPFLGWFNEPEGLTRSDPRFAGALPPFPTPDQGEKQFDRLPPSAAAASDPLVLKSDPITGTPLPFYDNPLAGGTSVVQDALPWLAGAAAVGAATPFIPAWLLAIGGALAFSRAVNAQESSQGAPRGTVAPGEGVYSTGASPFNAIGNGLNVDNTAGSSGAWASSSFGRQLSGASSTDLETRASTLADRFGNWVNTADGSVFAEPADPYKVPDAPAYGSAAPENVRRVNESNAGSVYTSGSAPVPYLPSTDFNERFGNWTFPTASSGQPQPSRPIGAFTDEPRYLIQPPIFGVDGPGKPSNDAEEWFSRWIQPLLRPE